MYLLFAWSKYQPDGGDDDFVGVFDRADAALAVFNTHEEVWKDECWIGHIATFDGRRFVRIAWMCRERSETIVEWE